MTAPDPSLRPTVLILTNNYLPGFKGGGPIRSISNVIEALGDTFRFLVLTRDRDDLDPEAYGGVKVDDWNEVGKAMVFYTSPHTLSLRGIEKILRETRHDLLYLNSFFSPRLSVFTILLRRVGWYRVRSVVIAPRGEFSPGALAQKPTKKHAYIWLARALGLYRNINWQATSELEGERIRHFLGNGAASISVTPNLPSVPPQGQHAGEPQPLPPREPGPLRIVFISRITPMKNLDFLLRALASVKADVEFTVYGPITDANYWALCQALVDDLSKNVVFKYGGEVVPERVSAVFAQHDVFVLPTMGENYGHAIFEALAAGTAVVLSDRTPWPRDSRGAVEVLSLEKPEAWVGAIERWADFNDRAFADRRVAAVDYVKRYLSSNHATDLTQRLFLLALERSARSE